MRRRRVIVVGAGPGGLAATGRLRERGGDAVEVTLVAPGPTATFLAGTLDVALGTGSTERFSCRVALAGVRCLDATVASAEPDGVVLREGGRLAADAVIAAPGLALDHDALPPWPRAVGAWDPEGAARAAAVLAGPQAGRLLIAATSLPYRCPPAPFALAVGAAEHHHRARHRTRIVVTTPEPVPLAGVGGEAPALVMEACRAAGVEVERSFVPDLGISADGLLCSADGRRLAYDAALFVPPHVRAPCLAGLPGAGPLVAVGDRGSVDGSTLYVVGDAAGTGLPRAAGFARGAALAAADGALEVLGVRPAPPAEAVEASCFMFHFGGAVSRLRVTGTASEPVVTIDGPSLDLRPAREGERRRFLAAAGAA